MYCKSDGSTVAHRLSMPPPTQVRIWLVCAQQHVVEVFWVGMCMIVSEALLKYNTAQKAEYKDSMAISIVSDKARVGNTDYLFAAILDPFGKRASWIPPQVLFVIGISTYDLLFPRF